MSKRDRIDRRDEKLKKRADERSQFRNWELDFQDEFDHTATLFGLDLSSGKRRKKGKGKHRVIKALKRIANTKP